MSLIPFRARSYIRIRAHGDGAYCTATRCSPNWSHLRRAQRLSWWPFRNIRCAHPGCLHVGSRLCSARLSAPAIVRRLRPTDNGVPCSSSTISTTPASQLSRRTASADTKVSPISPTATGSAISACTRRPRSGIVSVISIGERRGRSPRRCPCAIATSASARQKLAGRHRLAGARHSADAMTWARSLFAIPRNRHPRRFRYHRVANPRREESTCIWASALTAGARARARQRRSARPGSAGARPHR